MTSTSSRVTIEVAVDSIEDAAHAWRLGADRLEMCARLDLDGLTPPSEQVRELRSTLMASIITDSVSGVARRVRIAAMVRPSPTPFTCGREDFVRMQREISEMIEAGADAVVFGILGDDARIDVPRCRDLVGRCAGIETVFHRAFDRTPDAIESLDQLIDLGVTRVLTSGHAPSAATPQGIAGLARLVDHARGRIQILPGGGVRAANVAAILTASRCTQAHSSCRKTTPAGPRFDPHELQAVIAAAQSIAR